MSDYLHLVTWLVLFGILILVEAFTLGLTTIWFAGGALVAAFLSLASGNWIVEVIVFFTVSFVLLYFTRPWAVKYLNSKRTKTNYESLIGEIARVTERIDNLNASGTAVLNGQEWTARSVADSKNIEVGSIVIVQNISGVKLIVEEKKEA